jgi:hypothetical protein
LAVAVFASLSAAQRSSGGNLGFRGRGANGVGALLEGLEQLDHGLGGEVFVVVVVDLNHGCVNAGTQAFYLDKGKEAVGRGLALLDAEVVGDGLDNGVRAAAA